MFPYSEVRFWAAIPPCIAERAELRAECFGLTLSDYAYRAANIRSHLAWLGVSSSVSMYLHDAIYERNLPPIKGRTDMAGAERVSLTFSDVALDSLGRMCLLQGAQRDEFLTGSLETIETLSEFNFAPEVSIVVDENVHTLALRPYAPIQLRSVS